MFVGHYSAALAAKAAEPRAPLWTYVIGCQVLDIGWGALVAGGVEKVRIDPALPGSTLDLYHMPFTHSLPAALAWSLLAGAVVRMALRLPVRAAVFVGLAVFSHWILDLAVHRPDLALGFGLPKVGFALWNFPLQEEAVEIGLLAVAGIFWTAGRLRGGRRAWPAAVFITLLIALQIYASLAAPAPDTARLGITALIVYLAAGLVAWLVDREPAPRAAP